MVFVSEKILYLKMYICHEVQSTGGFFPQDYYSL